MEKAPLPFFNNEGRQIQEVELKGKDVSNITFGGKDERTCYCNVAGQEMH